MFFAHANKTRIGADDQHDKVRGARGEAEQGCLEILLMASQIDERDDFGRFVANLIPRQLLLSRGRVQFISTATVDIVRGGIETKNLNGPMSTLDS